ncbi:MAG: hypothetical protein AAFR56_13360 [Chloroflexota bacterium]
MQRILLTLAGALCLLMLPSVAWAQAPGDDPDTLTFAELDASIRAVDDMAARGVLTSEQAGAQVEYYLARASGLAGEPVDRVELARLANFTLASRIQGWFSFVNLIWVVGSVLIVGGVGLLFARYVLPLLLPMLPHLLEIGLYVGCGWFLYAGWNAADGTLAQFIALPGVLGLPVAVLYSLFRHRWLARLLVRFDVIERAQGSDDSPARVAAVIFLQPLYYALLVLWGVLAVLYGSDVIGFLAVVLLAAWFGFYMLDAAFLTVVGFQEWAIVPRVTAAGFVFLLVAVLVRITGVSHPAVDVFLPGLELIGTLVYFSGLLVMAAKWFWKGRRSYYVPMQLLTIGSGLAAIMVGSVYGLDDLRGIAGEYFLVYVVEKYAEVGWFRRNFAITAVTLGTLLYGIAYVVRRYPDFFLFVA